MKLKHTFLILSLASTSLFAQNKYYVNATNGSDVNDGTSWSKAFATLQPALDKAVANDEIRMAAGIYVPTKKITETTPDNKPTSERTKSFVIPNGVKLYGGFPAGATDATGMAQRNQDANPTILSGDFNQDDNDFDNIAENAYHVVVLLETDESTIIDGFTITGGNANGNELIKTGNISVYSHSGGGIYGIARNAGLASSPTLNNLRITQNNALSFGGGIFSYAEMGSCNPVISNVEIMENKSGINGAGIYINATKSGSPILTNVIISGNKAIEVGGGIFCQAENKTSPVLTNVLISGNDARDAAGMYCFSYIEKTTPVLTNVTIVGNKAIDDGAGLACVSSVGITAPEIRNTVIWGNKSKEYPNIYNHGATGSNPVIQYSLIEGEPANGSAGNLDGTLNPEFVNAVGADFAPTTDGNYRLSKISPLINKGKNDLITLTQDLLGQNRIIDGKIDIGAYEYPEIGGGTSNEELLIENNRIWTDAGNLYVKIEEPATISIYTVDGTLFHQVYKASEGTKVISLPTGIYFISLNENETKAKIFVPQQ